MKEFLKSNTVTYNLMSFTGFKSIIIFSLLLENPKSYTEIQQYLTNHVYLHESVSIDTIRIYINSLREIGCKISKSTKSGITRYSIDSHPFELNITKEQAKSILKVFKAISKSIDINDLISLEKFFQKFAPYISDENLKNKLKNISPLNNIAPEMLKNLMNLAQNKTKITILYNSPNSGRKNITIIVDKLSINNGKLYVSGFNSEYKNYAKFLVSKIVRIISINMHASKLETPVLTVGYEVFNIDKSTEILPNEKVIKNENNKTIIEITSPNKFDIIQRIMSYTNKCKVLYPGSFKSEIVNCLKEMKEGYIEEK